MKSTFEKTMLKISKGSSAGIFPVYVGYVDNDQCQISFECFDMKICIVEDNFWDCLFMEWKYCGECVVILWIKNPYIWSKEKEK